MLRVEGLNPFQLNLRLKFDAFVKSLFVAKPSIFGEKMLVMTGVKKI